MILNSKHHCDDNKFSELSNSESDNSSIFGNNRNSVSENSAADTMPTPVALTVPKQDLVNIVFTWNFGGQEAYLVGSFTGWTERLLMKKVGGNEFSLLHPLERGVHQYKFIVDGNWRFAGDQPTMRDNQGNINNFIDTTHYASSQSQTA